MSKIVLSICSWNVCGLGDDTKCFDVLPELILINPHITILQESKLETIMDIKIRSFLHRSQYKITMLPAVGSAGTVSGAISYFFQHISRVQNTFSTTLIRLQIIYIFYCFMLLYYQSYMLYMQFYIIFGN